MTITSIRDNLNRLVPLARLVPAVTPVGAVPGDIVYRHTFEDGDGACTRGGWTLDGANPDRASSSTDTADTSPRSLFTQRDDVIVTSPTFDASDLAADLDDWVCRGGRFGDSEFPDTGDDVELRYLTGAGTRVSLGSFQGGSTPSEVLDRTYPLVCCLVSSSFLSARDCGDWQGAPTSNSAPYREKAQRREAPQDAARNRTNLLDRTLDADALHARLRVRLVATGADGEGFDDWHVHTVTVTVTESQPALVGSGAGLLGNDHHLLVDDTDDGGDDGPYDTNPGARVTFGVFAGESENIYLREVFPAP